MENNFYKAKIELVTQSDATEFVSIAEKFDSKIYVENGDGDLRINAKSILGVQMALVEWSDLYCLYTDSRFGTAIMKFVR